MVLNFSTEYDVVDQPNIYNMLETEMLSTKNAETSSPSLAAPCYVLRIELGKF